MHTLAITSVQGYQAAFRIRLLLLIAAATTLALLAAALLWLERPLFALALVLLVAGGMVLLRRPAIGFYTVLAASLLFDRYKILELDLLTGRITFWKSYSGLSAADALTLLTLGCLVLRALHQGQRPLLRGGRLLISVALFTGALVYGVVRGAGFQDLLLAQRFNAVVAADEIIALAYIPLLYVLAHNSIRTARDVRIALWIIVAALGLKAIQAVWTVARLGSSVFDFNEIAVHEDSLLWAALVLLTIGLFACRGTLALRLTTGALLPLVILALVANQRRVGYFALAFGLVLAGVLFVADRRLRWPALLGGALATAVVAVYAAAFWNADQTDTPLALPVYAVRSISEPKTQADVDSNQWRMAENENIERSIRSEPLLGFGFGQRYYNWFGLRLNTEFDYWRYSTHNAIYWMWMKLGAIGFVLFWHLVASAIVLGVMAFRRLTDGDLRAAALMAAGLVAMQMIFSYADLGLNSSTSMAFFGSMLGLIASLDRLAVDGAGGGRWRR